MAILNNDKHSIGDLFNNRNPFSIPKHQRAYSWEEDEVDAFCTDVKEIDSEYFFGGVVSVYEHAQNTPGRNYRVVDGQQRIATFTILLTLLKIAFSTVANKAAQVDDETNRLTAESLSNDLHDKYLTYTDTRQRPPIRVNRLTLSKVDRDFFKDLLNGNTPNAGVIVSHKRLLHAWDKINRNLILPIIRDDNLSLEEQLDQLQILKDKILEHSVVIHIVCDNLDEAYQLFEVLNDRGKELAIGDYLRSNTLEQLDDNQPYQDQVAQCWDQILSKRDAEKYIKSYLISHVATIKNRNVHRQFQKTFFESANGVSAVEIRDRIINLDQMFNIYEAISVGDFPYTNPTTNTWGRNRLRLLINQLEHKLCVPFLLALYECGSEDDFKKSVFLIEKFVFRYITVSGLRANRLSDIYKKHILSMRIGGGINLQDFASDLLNIQNEYCNDTVFAQGIGTALIYKPNASTIKKIRYFLTTIEDYYSWYVQQNRPLLPRPSINVQYNLDSIDIEHIYPQNPINANTLLAPHANTIGNLTFWSPNDNRIASNNPFTVKKEYYIQSNVAITRLLNLDDDWNIAELNTRRDLYIDIAKHIFTVS